MARSRSAVGSHGFFKQVSCVSSSEWTPAGCSGVSDNTPQQAHRGNAERHAAFYRYVPYRDIEASFPSCWTHRSCSGVLGDSEIKVLSVESAELTDVLPLKPEVGQN